MSDVVLLTGVGPWPPWRTWSARDDRDELEADRRDYEEMLGDELVFSVGFVVRAARPWVLLSRPRPRRGSAG